MTRNSKLLLLGALTCTLVGCSGARGALRFDELKYPVSSSGYLYTSDGGKRLETVAPMAFDVKVWGIGWSIIPLSGDVDVSDEINKQIVAVDGEGVVNLTVTTDNCGVNYVWPLNLLPIWPGCVAVEIQGTIVRRQRRAASIPAEAQDRLLTLEEVDTRVRLAVASHVEGRRAWRQQ